MAQAGAVVNAVTIVKSAPQPPASLRRLAIERLLAAGMEPSPENLLRDSEAEDAPLHAFFFETPETVWIQFGRYQAARRILQMERTEASVGGRKIELRSIEAVRIGTIERWGTVEQIAASPELRDAYMREIEQGLAAYSAKLSKVRELMNK